MQYDMADERRRVLTRAPERATNTPLVAYVGRVVACLLTLALILGAFWLPGVLLKSMVIAVATFVMTGVWLLRAYYASGIAREMPVSNFLRR
jgi:hypothetical protein